MYSLCSVSIWNKSMRPAELTPADALKIAFRGPEGYTGEKIAVITYYLKDDQRIPELQVIGEVEGVY